MTDFARETTNRLLGRIGDEDLRGELTRRIHCLDQYVDCSMSLMNQMQNERDEARRKLDLLDERVRDLCDAEAAYEEFRKLLRDPTIIL